MKTITYNTSGTCSRQILITLNDEDTVENVTFIGGCTGNTIGISRLVKGMKATEVIARLKGTMCGMKRTSCPDQLALALEEGLKQ
ncbi:MAG: TIGR03905 family TSCPD domain-containing protein [Bacteroidaceae bacterium]|nr:TIGR03905 family TSCPD domain-containing protein [Bacteroidaceae bacterium]